MVASKKAGSQAGFALISGGVADVRVQVHVLHQLVNKVLRLVESSSAREHLYQVAGDLIMNIPTRISRIEDRLDETSYALALMGEDHLKDRLPLRRRTLVEEAVDGAPAFESGVLRRSAERVLLRHLARRVARRHLGRG
jgi:hypothetical protein